jgi:hypothetical protein
MAFHPAVPALASAAIFSLVSLAAPVALAAPATPENVASARALYNDGSAALDDKRYPVAREKLAAAWALVQTPIIGAALAEAQAALGELVEAQETCFAVARIEEAAGETAASKQARAQAAALSDGLAKRVATVALVVTGQPSPGVDVLVDGVVVPAPALGSPRVVNPGKHVVAVRTRKGTTVVAEPEVREGGRAEVKVALPRESAPPPQTGPAATAPAPAAPAEKGGGWQGPAFWGGVGLAGAGVAAGGIFGFLAFDKRSDVDAQCRDKVCPPSAQSDIDSSKTFGTVSTIAFAAAGVGAALAVVAIVLKPSRPAQGAFRGVTFSF